MKLHLGVVDVPYVSDVGTSTGDVAQILEDKYGVMQAFADAHLGDIASDLEKSLSGHLQNRMAGAPAGNPFAEATSKIEARFRNYLATAEIEKSGVEGVPTEAALKGRSNRFKSRKGKRRPSFIDTGLYSKSAKSWVNDG